MSPLVSPRLARIVFPAERKRRKTIDLGLKPDGAPQKSALEPGLSLEDTSFFRWLFEQAGLDLSLYRSEVLQRRLPSCLRALKADSPRQARRLLEDDPTLVAPALSAVLVGVTSFFRDPPVFDVLRDELLPALAGSRRRLQVWSAGASDGAELYSVAILLEELGLLEGSYLLGTDCRQEAIERAKLGWFERRAVDKLPPGLLERYFVPEGRGFQVVPSLRCALRWRAADLLKEMEPGLWDLILFRNTAIYLHTAALEPLWEALEKSLRPGGVLVLGKAERPSTAKRLSLVTRSVYRRVRR